MNRTTNFVFLLFSSLFVFFLTETGLVSANPYGTQKSDLPLFAKSVVDCDEMVLLHRWEGSCCSLNGTTGNGCILNVMNGNCRVRGQVWTLDYNSTYDTPCPNSEYTWQDLGMKSDPNPDAGDGSGGSTVTAFMGHVLPLSLSLLLLLLGSGLAGSIGL